jgi:hypothetical protein
MEIARKFNVADAILLVFTGKVLEFLPGDLAKFTAFDPDLNAAKQTILKGVYLNALTFGTDKTEVSVVSKLTEDLSAQFKNCISIFKDVRYFNSSLKIKRQFCHNPIVL